MSHHFDSPTAIADGRINLCDLFVFPGAPGTTALILTVNPDAGRSSAATFRPDALYEFVVASDGGTREDIAFRHRELVLSHPPMRSATTFSPLAPRHLTRTTPAKAPVGIAAWERLIGEAARPGVASSTRAATAGGWRGQ